MWLYYRGQEDQIRLSLRGRGEEDSPDEPNRNIRVFLERGDLELLVRRGQEILENLPTYRNESSLLTPAEVRTAVLEFPQGCAKQKRAFLRSLNIAPEEEE